MKLPSPRGHNGFTLIELLVVITIIMVLAAGGFAAATAAIEKARRASALAAATSIETAVNNFYTEYNTLPTTSTSEDDITVETKASNADGMAFLDILLGYEAAATAMNSRAIRFLNVKDAKNSKGGLMLTTTATATNAVGLHDPWGGPYFVELDLSYDERVEPDTAVSNAVTLTGRRVAVWTNGADNTTGTVGKGKIADDVKTW